jgi:hypothetical protein
MLTHYSRLFPSSQPKLSKLTNFTATTMSVPSKALLLSDFSTTVGLLFVDPFGLIQFVSNIVVYNITATSFEVAGNLGDSTSHYHPCSVDGVLAIVPVLAPRKLAVQLNLPIGSVCPTTLDAPDPTLPPPDLAALGFADVTNGTDDAAIITLVGTVLPWPMGIPPPTGNFIGKTAIYPTEAQVYGPGVLWFGSMKILWEANAGKPLHMPGPLFDSSQVITPNDFVGIALSDILSPSVQSLPIGSPTYVNVLDLCSEHCAMAAAVAGVNVSPPNNGTPNTGHSSPTAPVVNLSDFATALTNTFQAFATQHTPRQPADAVAMSLTDQGKVASLKVSIARQRLLLGRVITKMGDDGITFQETFLQNLSSGLMGPMADTSQLDRCTHLFENWRHAANRLANAPNSTWIASYIDIMRLSSCYDSFWAKCLLMGTCSPHANPVQFPSTFTQMVSIFNFLVPYPESKAYIARSAAGHLEHAELMAEEHQSKRQRTNTKLALDGKQHTHAHLMALLANLYSWFLFMSGDPSDNASINFPGLQEPIIIQIVLRWANLFKSPEAKSWFEFFHSQTHLVHSIMLDINASLSPIFQLIGEQEYRTAATDDTPIPPAVYTACLANAEHQVDLYVTQIRTFRLNLTSVPPSYGGICCPLPPNEQAQHASQKKLLPKDKQRSSTPSQPATPDNATPSPGILTWTKEPGSQLGPPKNSTIWHSLNGRMGRLCSNYMIRGMTCKRERECRFLHLNKLSDLSPDNKRLFTQWVNENPTLEFASTTRTPVPPVPPTGNTPTPHQARTPP